MKPRNTYHKHWTIRFTTTIICLLVIYINNSSGYRWDTTTVGLDVRTDITSIGASTGRILNMSIMGLDQLGNVDVYGESGGSGIIASISTLLGSSISGDSSPALAYTNSSTGTLSTIIKYIHLEQGIGLTNILYPNDANGTDIITITLYEARNDEGGNVATRQIATQHIEIEIAVAKSLTETDIITTDSLSKFDIYPNSENDYLVLPINGAAPLAIFPRNTNGKLIKVANGYVINFDTTGIAVRNSAGTNLVNGANIGSSTSRYVVKIEAKTTPGTYELKVISTDASITKTIKVKVIENTTPLTLGIYSTEIVLGTTKSIPINGGVTPYTVNIEPADQFFIQATIDSSTLKITGNDLGGPYIVTVTDANASVKTLQVTVVSPRKFSVTPSTVSISIGESIRLSISAGTPPYVISVNQAEYITLDKTELTADGYLNITGIRAGSCSVSVKDASGATVVIPVNVKEGETGSLTVTISPQSSITSGAQWRVDNGIWQESGATVTSLSIGSHNVDFKDVTGWTKPANQTVMIQQGQTTTSTGTYIPITYSITATAGTGGNISPSGSVSVSQNSNKTFTITANAGYQIADVTVNGNSVGSVSSYTFNKVTSNQSIAATFSSKKYTITANVGTGGTISPSGSVSVTHGSSQAFTITANSGYQIADVKVDGTSVGAVSTYTFSNVTANNIIEAAFVLTSIECNFTSDTGQEKCYNDSTEIPCPNEGQPFYGQDAQYNNDKQRYKDNGDGTVTDLNTGLMWQKEDDGIERNWNDTNTYCDNLIFAGYSDWRLPTLSELRGIVDYGQKNPMINPVFICKFPNSWSGATYWSSTMDVNNSANVWLVSFYGGSGPPLSGALPKTDVYSMRAVRARSCESLDSQNHLMIDNGDGTVTDQTTGLMWQKSDDGVERKWSDALVYCENLNLAGYSDWRLPNIKELLSITDNSKGKGSPTINQLFTISSSIHTEIMVATLASFYWSSTTDINHTDMAYLVGFIYGMDGYSSKDGYGSSKYGSYVRAVRNQPYGSYPLNSSYSITASAGTGGTISPSGSVSVNQGASQIFTISANDGFEIDDVKVNGTSVGKVSTYTISNVTFNQTISATFTAISKEYTLTSIAGTGGLISPSSPVTITHGGSQTYTITPDTCYDIADVTVDGNSVGAVSTYTFNNVTANHSITATFIDSVKTYTLTVIAKNGKVFINPQKPAYSCNETVSLIAEPETGYTFKGWTKDSSGLTNPLTIKMDKAKTITALFEAIALPLIISPNVLTITETGSVHRFTITGGKSPYTAVAQNGSATVNQTTVTYTAPAITTDDVLTVYDAAGKNVTAIINFSAANVIKLAVAEKTVARGEVVDLEASGGMSELIWTAPIGGSFIPSDGYKGPSVQFKAPNELGDYTVTVADNANNTRSIMIHVRNKPVLSPKYNWINEDYKDVIIQVVGGNPPYVWTVDKGAIEPQQNTSSAIFTSPRLIDAEATITVTDHSGLQDTATVFINRPMSLRQEFVVSPGKTVDMIVSGGYPPFKWNAVTGEFRDKNGNIINEGEVVVYHASDLLQDDTITVTDASGNMCQSTVYNRNPLSFITVSKSVQLGDSVSMELQGGVPPYQWSIDNSAEILSYSDQNNASASIQVASVATPTLSSKKNMITITVTDKVSGHQIQGFLFVMGELRVNP
ncbi:MAG: DUF1566 domain-containing protein, partial [Desulfobacterales bacterium]|nr:DUF1566 domain-containing protein [Desulfobacterales bacterium]